MSCKKRTANCEKLTCALIGESRLRGLTIKAQKVSTIISVIKGAVGSADLKISKSALLSLNHHNFSNTKPIYTE